MGALLTAWVAAVALFAWFSLVKVVPDCATSRFRYRLWQLRDELVDDVRHDEFSNGERARRFVSSFEWAIEQAADLSALNLILLHISRPHSDRADPLALDGLDPADAQRLGAYREKFEVAVATKALLGTPSGWIALVLVVPIGLVVTAAQWLFRKDRRGGGVIARVRRHLVADFEMNPALGRKRRGPLYEHI